MVRGARHSGTMQVLNLRGTGMGDLAAKQVRAGHLLQRRRRARARVSDSGSTEYLKVAEWIAEDSEGLTYINLADNKIEKDGARDLAAALGKNTHLRIVILKGPRLSVHVSRGLLTSWTHAPTGNPFRNLSDMEKVKSPVLYTSNNKWGL